MIFRIEVILDAVYVTIRQKGNELGPTLRHQPVSITLLPSHHARSASLGHINDTGQVIIRQYLIHVKPANGDGFASLLAGRSHRMSTASFDLKRPGRTKALIREGGF